MSSDDEYYKENSNEIPDELNIILINEEFQELLFFLQKMQKEDTCKIKILTTYAFKNLIKKNHFVPALELMCVYSDLIEKGFPNDTVIDKFFDIVKDGDIQELEKMIPVFGFYPKIVSNDGFDLFSKAVHSDQYLMMKFLYKELGVESRHEHNLIKAAGLGNKNMLSFLYEELGIEPSNSDTIVRFAVESGSLDCLKYIRHYIGINKLHDWKILEVGVFNAVMNHRIDLLDFLLNYFVIDFDPASIPPYRRNCLKQNSFYNSLYRAVQSNDSLMISYLLHVVKLDLDTDNPENERNCYLELLQIAVKKGYEEILKILIEDAQLQPSLLPKLSEEDLAFTIQKSKIEVNVKKRMIEFLQKFDQNPNYEIVLSKIDEEFTRNSLEGPHKKLKIENASYD